MHESNFVPQCGMYSVQSVTPLLARDPEREEAMPSKRPQAPATAVETRVSVTLSETVQKAANPLSIVSPSARNIVSIPSIPTSVHIPASSRDLASVCYQATIHHAAHDITCAVPHSVHNPNCVPPASNHDTASSPCSVRNSCSVPSHVSSSVPKSPSIRFSVPKNPQLASRSTHTPNAIRSWLQWQRSCPSHCAPVCEHPQARHPPHLSALPSPRFTQPANPHNELHATQPSSNEQPANHH